MTKTKTFSGGVHPVKGHTDKLLTAGKPVVRLNAPQQIVIPLSQHTGSPAQPLVKEGDRVLLGQKIAQAGSFVSANIHSSVSGVVKAVSNQPHISGAPVLSIVIENDGQDTPDPSIQKREGVDSLSAGEIIGIIQEAGVVGMGGAAFPLHVKLSPPPGSTFDTILLNAAECEPYLTADHRLMLEQTAGVVTGFRLLQKAAQAQRAVIAIEDNKPDAIDALRKAAQGSGIEVQVLKSKYPQGAEKQIITSVTGREVPSCGLPYQVGVLVSNSATAYAVYQAVVLGIPLFERIVTVTGCVKEPANFLCRVGTPLSALVEAAGGFAEAPAKLVSGGPMMGLAIHTLEFPVMKATSGLLALSAKEAKKTEESNCIRCGQCVRVCPIGLEPLTLNAYALKGDFEKAETAHALDCIECGCCSYSCPAKRYLAQSIRLAKNEIMKSRKKKSS